MAQHRVTPQTRGMDTRCWPSNLPILHQLQESGTLSAFYFRTARMAGDWGDWDSLGRLETQGWGDREWWEDTGLTSP